MAGELADLPREAADDVGLERGRDEIGVRGGLARLRDGQRPTVDRQDDGTLRGPVRGGAVRVGLE